MTKVFTIHRYNQVIKFAETFQPKPQIFGANPSFSVEIFHWSSANFGLVMVLEKKEEGPGSPNYYYY